MPIARPVPLSKRIGGTIVTAGDNGIQMQQEEFHSAEMGFVSVTADFSYRASYLPDSNRESLP